MDTAGAHDTVMESKLQLIQMSVTELIGNGVMLAIMVMGIVQSINKNIAGAKKWLGLIAFLVTVCLGVVNSPIVPLLWTTIIDLTLMAWALAQMGHDAILSGIPKLIDRVIGGKGGNGT